MQLIFPTLKTLLLVEKFLLKHEGQLFSKAKIIRNLNGKINNSNLTTILNYLEASNKIMQGPKGIMYLKPNNNIKELYKDAIVI